MEIKLISIENSIELYAEIKDNILSNVFTKNLSSHTFENIIFCDDLVIPDGVVEIVDDAFYRVSHIFNFNKIIFPGSLRKIGKRAFYKTLGSSLRSIKLPTNLEYIGDQAFEGESSGSVIGVKSLTIPNKVVKIGERAFANWKKLNTLKLGKALKQVGHEAFLCCENLKRVEGSSILKDNCLICDNCVVAVFGDSDKITIPEGVTEIDDFAFSSTFDSCSHLSPITDIQLPSTLKSIGNGAFSGTNIRSLHLPDSIENISANPIRGTDCVSLTGKFSYKDIMLIQDKRLICFITGLKSVEVPEGVETIGRSCFYCYGAEEILLPDGLKTIEPFAFSYNKIKELKLPDTIESIGSYAFNSCYKLESLIIPASLTYLGKLPFCDMTNCKKITFLGELPPLVEKEEESVIYSEYINPTAVIRVPSKSIEEYRLLFPQMAKPDAAYPNGRVLPLKE